MFVRPPDPVVADLFLDYANVMSRFGTLGEAKHLFNLARTYGAKQEQVDSELRLAHARVDEYHFQRLTETISVVAVLLLILVTIIAGLAWSFKRKRVVRS